MNEDILSLRGDLIDWLLIVCSTLKLNDLTYFMAVEIFDRVLEKIELNDVEGLHILVITSLIIASKYNEVRSIGLDFAVKSICHNKYTKEQLRDTEMIILKTINFKIVPIHFEEFALEISNQIIENKQSDNLRDLSPSKTLQKSLKSLDQSSIPKALNFVYKLVLQDYESYRTSDNITLYFAILYFTLSNGLKVEQLKVKFKSFKFF